MNPWKNTASILFEHNTQFFKDIQSKALTTQAMFKAYRLSKYLWYSPCTTSGQLFEGCFRRHGRCKQIKAESCKISRRETTWAVESIFWMLEPGSELYSDNWEAKSYRVGWIFYQRSGVVRPHLAFDSLCMCHGIFSPTDLKHPGDQFLPYRDKKKRIRSWES